VRREWRCSGVVETKLSSSGPSKHTGVREAGEVLQALAEMSAATVLKEARPLSLRERRWRCPRPLSLLSIFKSAICLGMAAAGTRLSERGKGPRPSLLQAATWPRPRLGSACTSAGARGDVRGHGLRGRGGPAGVRRVR
jgi:hypothetical protein